MHEPTQIVVVPYSVYFWQSSAGFASLVAIILSVLSIWTIAKVFPKAPEWVFLVAAILVSTSTIYWMLS